MTVSPVTNWSGGYENKKITQESRQRISDVSSESGFEPLKTQMLKMTMTTRSKSFRCLQSDAELRRSI
jgi:hypothetical protein